MLTRELRSANTRDTKNESAVSGVSSLTSLRRPQSTTDLPPPRCSVWWRTESLTAMMRFLYVPKPVGLQPKSRILDSQR
jgi:hypothetical protein